MSTGLNCIFVEISPGEWFYILEDWDSPKGGYDWLEYATGYGPFSSWDEADRHLGQNHANPGGSSTEGYSKDAKHSESLLNVIKDARDKKRNGRIGWF